VADLTTLVVVKAWLDISTTNSDTVLTRLITAGSAFLINWLNRNILSSSYVNEKYNGNGHQSIRLRNWPITAVSSVAVNGTQLTVSADGITNGFIFDDNHVYILPGTSIDRFCKGVMNISIGYTAGYATVPFDVEQACVELVSRKFKERTRIGMTSQSLGGQETNSFSKDDLSKDTKSMLQNYRNVIPN
jgi:hypothetical protein